MMRFVYLLLYISFLFSPQISLRNKRLHLLKYQQVHECVKNVEYLVRLTLSPEGTLYSWNVPVFCPYAFKVCNFNLAIRKSWIFMLGSKFVEVVKKLFLAKVIGKFVCKFKISVFTTFSRFSLIFFLLRIIFKPLQRMLISMRFWVFFHTKLYFCKIVFV